MLSPVTEFTVWFVDVVDELVGVSWLTAWLDMFVSFRISRGVQEGKTTVLFNLDCETDRVSEEAVQMVEERLLAASSDYSENVVDVALECFHGKLGGPLWRKPSLPGVP
ncbi:LOW QUALITY PROTEIN: hypothetical protein M513_11985 [Trichuris suis]|uniref:Uncharacterized protein n=1 Tax=Trichuris suis TaxID=68888 RepID=A0A085LQ89_9BILA|nr:LOW QUALITY PROTEIN: hypothetical protein M513_11985 [Trichuris suis]